MGNAAGVEQSKKDEPSVGGALLAVGGMLLQGAAVVGATVAEELSKETPAEKKKREQAEAAAQRRAQAQAYNPMNSMLGINVQPTKQSTSSTGHVPGKTYGNKTLLGCAAEGFKNVAEMFNEKNEYDNDKVPEKQERGEMLPSSEVYSFMKNTKIMVTFGTRRAGMLFALEMRNCLINMQNFKPDEVYIDSECLKRHRLTKHLANGQTRNPHWEEFYYMGVSLCHTVVWMLDRAWIRSPWCRSEMQFFIENLKNAQHGNSFGMILMWDFPEFYTESAVNKVLADLGFTAALKQQVDLTLVASNMRYNQFKDNKASNAFNAAIKRQASRFGGSNKSYHSYDKLWKNMIGKIPCNYGALGPSYQY